jgi:hypothetical protein
VRAEANRFVGRAGSHSEIKETKPTNLTTCCTVLFNAILDCSNGGSQLSGR